ncbi:hypothetical protein F4806DRAFT_361312 [Annulohypoxylon nitens]|nr:hypothetical protein F4806DRAFT_361312 [Annulohypoxylon nitens]
MTSWEASQSPPRHSTHHRRRHHKPRDENQSYHISNISNDRPSLKHPRKQHRSDLAIVNPHRPSNSHTRYDIIENWLAQTARQSPHSFPKNSQGHRREDAHSHHSSRPLNTIAPYNKHPRHVDQRWSPRHGFPADKLPQAASPFRDPGTRDPRKSRRRRIATSDSSFISGFGNTTRPPDYGPGPILQVREYTPPARSPREAGLAPPDASSIAFHVDDHMNFEKRPRHKTREDKYETKKKKRHHEKDGTRGHEEDPRKKHKKAQKRKSAISSKNVVNNFTSDAVLNDRITVQPHLKPGLFDNGRTSKRQPVSDLAFSEMQFLKHQKRNHQPKPLSKSRLREKRREDREMEEVSSFFLPHGADRKMQTPRPRGTISENSHREMEYQAKQFASTRFQGNSGLSTSDHLLCPDPTHVFTHRETAKTLILSPHGCVDDGKDSGKSTTYFTWSTSHYSPQDRRRGNSSSPDESGSERTTTPENIRRDLIATGIYRDTGIPLYDDRLTEQNTKETEMNTKTLYINFTESEDKNRSPFHDFNGSQKVEYRDQAIMTESPVDCSEPAFKPQEPREYQVSGSQRESSPQASHATQEIDRQKIVRDARLNPPSKDSLRPNTQHPSPLGAKAIATHRGPGLARTESTQNLERQAHEMSDPTSVASKDMMPPPPIPPCRNNSAMSLDANMKKAGPPTPTHAVPPTDMEPDVLKAHHKANHNNTSQDFQGLLKSNNQITSLSEPAITNGHMLSSFDAASWIPQRTPSARTETQSITSRPSMKSPFYADQYERTSSGNSYRGDLSRTQKPESMAEFIARIENESQQQSLLYDDNTSCSELDLEKAGRDSFIFDREPPNQQSPNYDERPNTHPYLDPYSHLLHTDIDRSNEYYQSRGEYYIEPQYPLDHSNVPRTLSNVARPLGDFEEEHFDMSNFWRPNQLYQV